MRPDTAPHGEFDNWSLVVGGEESSHGPINWDTIPYYVKIVQVT